MLPITKKHISMNYSVGRVIVPKYVVIHETGNTSNGANATAHFNYWNTNSSAQASTHFVVDDHTIMQMLELNERAWHVGDNKGYSTITNDNTIGIEICINADGNYMTARSNAIELTAYLLKKFGFGIDRLKRHKDASGKQCPEHMVNDPALWTNFVNQVNAKLTGIVTPIANDPGKYFPSRGYYTVGDTGSYVTTIQTTLNKLGYKLSTDGKFGPATKAAVVDFQKKNKLVADGLLGPATWNILIQKTK